MTVNCPLLIGYKIACTNPKLRKRKQILMPFSHWMNEAGVEMSVIG